MEDEIRDQPSGMSRFGTWLAIVSSFIPRLDCKKMTFYICNKTAFVVV
jgi:hypothetical protein